MGMLSELATDERRARMVLSMITEPRDRTTGRVLAQAGAVEALHLVEDDAAVPGLSEAEAGIWRAHLTARATDSLPKRLRAGEDGSYVILIPGDAAWPSGLDDMGERGPYVLWTRGAQSISATTSLSDRAALTGARAASQYGIHVAADLARDLAERERVVVTGGAHGVEAAALRGALSAGGHTIAVQPSGLDRPYPHGNRELLEEFKDRGLLISELPPRTQPTRHRILARGRLLAALTGATVVVEAAARSSAIATAQSAKTLGRQVGESPDRSPASPAPDPTGSSPKVLRR